MDLVETRLLLQRTGPRDLCPYMSGFAQAVCIRFNKDLCAFLLNEAVGVDVFDRYGTRLKRDIFELLDNDPASVQAALRFNRRGDARGILQTLVTIVVSSHYLRRVSEPSA